MSVRFGIVFWEWGKLRSKMQAFGVEVEGCSIGVRGNALCGRMYLLFIWVLI